MRHERKRAAQGHVDSTGTPKSRSKFAGPRTAAVSHKGRHRGPRSTSSQHRGVTQHRRTKKWEAHIWDARKQMYLGGYSTEEEAARAHDIMALKCRGLDSTLNYDKKDYTFLEDKLNSMSKDDVRIRLLGKDSRLSSPFWSAQHQAHEEDEHHIVQEQHVTHSSQTDPAEGTTSMRQDMHRNQIPLPDGFVATDEDIFFSDDADALSVDNDSATSDVCSLAEPLLQDWTKPNKHVTNKGVPKDMIAHAQSPLLPDSLCNTLLAIDSSPSSIFGHKNSGHQNSARSHFASDTATDLLQQSLHMHTVSKARHRVEPDQYYGSKGSSSLYSAAALANSITESDMYSRTGQLLDMPASAHIALHKDIINSPRALLPDGTQRPCMPKHTHNSSFNTYTDSIGNKSLSSRIMSNPHALSAEALTSAWSGQRLETRCTSTGHSNFATHLRAEVYKPPTASNGQARFQERYPRPTPNLAFSLADQLQACKPSMAQPVSTQLHTSIPDGLRDYIAPSSPVLLPSPRQPLFLSSFNLTGDGLVPSPSTPPWYSNMHSPSIARSPEHISNSAEIHEAYAQQAQFRGMHPW